jgi:rhamnulose-1-phosphate aldolase
VTDLLALSPEVERLLRDAQEVCGYLWDRGWAESHAGNLTADVTDTLVGLGSTLDPVGGKRLSRSYPTLAGRYFLVTGTGRRFRDFARDAEHNSMVLRLDEQGAGYAELWGGLDGLTFRPTSEFSSHLALQEHLLAAGGRDRVVLHSHPTELIALTHMPECRHERNLNRLLWSVLSEVKMSLPKGVGLVPYRVPGSEELAVATEEAIRRGHVVALWQYHGCLAVGSSPSEAFDRIDVANKAARVALLCRSAGHRPEGLGPAQLAELDRIFNTDS